MKRNFLKLGVLAILLTVVLFVSCNLYDAALVGTWENDSLTLTFTDDGKITFEGLLAAFITLMTLGGEVEYTAADGAGEYWYKIPLLGDSDHTAFTYTISGDILTTNIFNDDPEEMDEYARK